MKYSPKIAEINNDKMIAINERKWNVNNEHTGSGKIELF